MTSPVTAASAQWPREIFSAPIFRGLDERALQEIETAGKLRWCTDGEIVFAQRSPADAFFVAARGVVVLSASRTQDSPEAYEVRRVAAGELFGEEATVGVARQSTAKARGETLVAEIPVHLFRRAIVRLGKAELLERLERTLKRAAAKDVLGATPLAQSVDEGALDMLLDAVTYGSFARGQTLYRAGDASTSIFIVGDGLVQMQSEDGGRVRVLAYFGRGDFFGDEELELATPRQTSAIANGPTTVLMIPARIVRALAQGDETLFARLRKSSLGLHDRQRALVGGAAKNATQHVFRDLYKMQIASSLLVIDLDTCVRCGHCAWACASLYGESRLLREGDKVLRQRTTPAHEDGANVFEGSFGGSLASLVTSSGTSSLLLPNSCQHCENPACMVDCPTGAIAKDEGGEVFIRQELCTGCGACARSCPWQNIQMVLRARDAPKPKGTLTNEVADKCDLCRTEPAGPMCVRACPVNAITRVHPKDDWSEVAEALGRRAASTSPTSSRFGPRQIAALLVPLAAVLSSIVISVSGALMMRRGLVSPNAGRGYAAGWIAAGAIVWLVAYFIPKRGSVLLRRLKATRLGQWIGRRTEERLTRTNPHYRLHLAVGVVGTASVFWHAPRLSIAPGSIGGLLFLALVIASGSGLLLAVLYAVLPRLLTRVERKPLLPESLGSEKEALETRLFRGLSGKDLLLKKVAEKVLLPYARSPVRGLRMLVTGADLRSEELRLKRTIAERLDGRIDERLAGLDEIVRASVELAALPLVRVLTFSLRGLLPIHIVAFLGTLVLLALHIWTARS